MSACPHWQGARAGTLPLCANFTGVPQCQPAPHKQAVHVCLKLPPARSPLTSAGVPYSDVNLRTGKGSMPAWGQISSLSEISSVSLEFTYLAR